MIQILTLWWFSGRDAALAAEYSIAVCQQIYQKPIGNVLRKSTVFYWNVFATGSSGN